MKVGDIVTIIDNGYVYSMYEELAEYLKLKGWAFGKSPPPNAVGVIIRTLPHPRHGAPLSIVMVDGASYIFGNLGLKPHSRVLGARFMIGGLR